MLSRKNIYAILSCLPLLGFVTSSYADMVTNQRELAILPEYCKGTQQIREISPRRQNRLSIITIRLMARSITISIIIAGH